MQIMRLRFIALLPVFLVLSEGCSSSPAGVQIAPPVVVPTGNTCAENEILFSVIILDGQRVPDVEISTTSRVSGITKIGATNRFGEACIRKAEAFAPEVLCLLFCTRNFHCTALINEEGISDFRELPIVLSPMVVF